MNRIWTHYYSILIVIFYLNCFLRQFEILTNPQNVFFPIYHKNLYFFYFYNSLYLKCPFKNNFSEIFFFTQPQIFLMIFFVIHSSRNINNQYFVLKISNIAKLRYFSKCVGTQTF